MLKIVWTLLATLAIVPALSAQTQNRAEPSVVGTWKVDLTQGDKKESPRTVVVRPDSSASYGVETVRWRLVDGDLWLALGGEWVAYEMELRRQRLVLSGGDLAEPVTFDRIGPPTARPDSIEIPPDPGVGPF